MKNVTYRIRFIHKVSNPRPDYADYTVCISSADTDQEICAKLRACGALLPGQRAREVRRKANEIVVFPMRWRGITTVPHSLILEPLAGT